MYKGEQYKLESYYIPLDDLIEYYGREIEHEKKERKRRKLEDEDKNCNEFER